MRWVVGIVGIAVFLALGVAAIVTKSPGALVGVAVFGALLVVAYLRHPETFKTDDATAPRDTSALAIAAWVVGIAGLASCIVSFVADIDILLLVGAFMCGAAAILGAAAAERRLPSSVPKTWWGLGRRAFSRRSDDSD